MSTEKKKVLVMADWFAPGYKAGGPIRSCVNFTEHLKHQLDIYVFTTDRDFNEASPYKGIVQDKWVQYDPEIKIFYASPSWLSFNNIRKTIRDVNPAIVYLNSMYSRFFSFYPLLLKRMGSISAKFILSPRGMLRGSALQFKSSKKRFFLKFFRMAGLQKDLTFHCTDATEVNDVKTNFGDVPTILLSNLPNFQRPLMLPSGKKRDQLRILFVGRIHPIKNVDFLLRAIQPLTGAIELMIIASVEDKQYWKNCEMLINEFPSNIKVNFKGEVPNEAIKEILVTEDIFALPTQGENFGHAIFEALSAGRPVVISDQTPWRGLSQWKAGWDIALSDPGKFTEVLRRFACMDQEELNEWCVGAWQFAKNYIEHGDIKKKYLELFS
jgi:glycosyltransferase involved in cell wall biosynthesis